MRFFSLSTIITILSFAISNSALAQSLRNSTDNFANRPTVSVGGFVNVTAGGRDSDESFDTSRLPNEQIGATDASGTQNPYSNDVDFANDSEIHIKVGGINEFGIKYGGVVELEADISTDGRDEGFNSDKTYIFTESRSGRLEFGNNIGANQKMKVGPTNFARAAGGINGKYLEYINAPMLADSTQDGITSIGNCDGFRVDATGLITVSGSDCTSIKLPRFILIAQSPVSHGGYAQGFYNRAADNNYDSGTYSYNEEETDNLTGFNLNSDGSFGQLEDATKISYYTPRVSGWQFGASFSPDTANNGSSASFNGDESDDIANVIGWGTNYSNNFGNLGLALSATGEVGKYEGSPYSDIKRNDLNAYEVGVMATYFGFTFGGSYGSWGDSLMPKTGIYSCQYDVNFALASQDCTAATSTEYDDSIYWTAGLAYQFGPIAFSATHITSEFQENKYNATSVGLDYRMAKGLMPYLEATQFEFESDHVIASDVNQSTLDSSAQQIRDNSGYVVLAGILFSF